MYVLRVGILYFRFLDWLVGVVAPNISSWHVGFVFICLCSKKYDRSNKSGRKNLRLGSGDGAMRLCPSLPIFELVYCPLSYIR